MAKEATLQVRMDADLKADVELLYKNMGTTFSEAVRIFARQSLLENGMPFIVHLNTPSTRGALSAYADPAKIQSEDSAFEKAVIKKHENHS